MHPNPTQAHPTRSAPLCRDCAHCQGAAYCNHPAYPVSLTSGKPFWSCQDMRSDQMSETFCKTLFPKCGSQGLLFVPARSAQVDARARGHGVEGAPQAAEVLIQHGSDDQEAHKTLGGGCGLLAQNPLD